FARESSLLRVRNVGCILVSAAVLSILPLAGNVEAGEVSSQAYLQNDTKSGVDAALWLESSLKRIFPKTAPGTTNLTLFAARNGRISFQACLQNRSIRAQKAQCSIGGADDLKVQGRSVGLGA